MAIVIAITGNTHSGKSSLLGTFMTGLWNAKGLKTRIYTGDGGGIMPYEHVIEAGAAEAWDFGNHIHPFETINDVVRGAWPERIDGGPTAKLLPLWLTEHLATCPKCGESKPVEKPVVGAMCAKCKVTLTFTTKPRMNPANSLEGYGAVVVEGLTSAAEMLMADMSDRSARGEKMGEEVAVRFTDGDLKIAGSSRSSYGIAQRRMKDAIEASRHLPVRYVLWTALEDKGTDEDTRKPVFGPKLVGQAATSTIPKSIGPLLSLTVWNLSGGKTERRLYTTTYFTNDSPDIPHFAGTRLPPAVLEGFKEYFVYEKSNATFLWDIVADIEERLAKAKELLKKKTK